MGLGGYLNDGVLVLVLVLGFGLGFGLEFGLDLHFKYS